MAMEDFATFEKVCFLDACAPEREKFDPINDKKRSDCEEEKYKLVEFDALPNYLKDNEFIVGYYRCEWKPAP